MKKVKETKAYGLYVFEGRVAANSSYFENIEECKKFLIYANYFLKDIMTIHEFILTRHGWHMLVKIKSKDQIQDFNNSKTSGNDSPPNSIEIWKIVSEQVRLFLSTFVRVVNKRRGRTGVLVHSSYMRFCFESLREAKSHILKLREQLLKLSQKRKKYCGKKNHWEVTKKRGSASIFLCSKYLDRAIEKAKKILGKTIFKGSQDLVLHTLVKKTLQLHNHVDRSSTPLKI